MKRLLLTLAMSFVITGLSQARTIQLIEGAHEFGLNEVSLPLGVTGTAFVVPCETCNSIGFQATAETRYEFNGSSVTLAELRDIVDGIHDSEGSAGGDTFVGIFYNLETRFLTRIAVFTH